MELHFFKGGRVGRFYLHGEKRAEEEKSCAPDLRLGEALAEKERGQTERARRTKKLERLGKSDADLANGDVVQNVREADAGHGGDDEDDVHSRIDLERRPDFSERQGEGQEQSGSDEADHAETAGGSEPGGRPFYENAIKRPAKARGERDGESLERDRSRFPSFLKTDDADRADQPEDGPDLKLPLADDPSFLREKDEREQCGEDNRGAAEDGVDAGPHVKKRDRLGDLVDDVRQRRDEADEKKSGVQTRSAFPKAMEDKGQHGEEAHQVTVKILRPRVVITVEVKLKE